MLLSYEEFAARADAVRAQIGKEARDLNVQQFCCGGLNFGYFYEASPIIAYDGSQHPPYTMDVYAPSTVPGCRTPHLTREDGGSLYDAMGPEFTLLRLDPDLDAAPIELAARQRGVPLKVVDIKTPATAIFQPVT